MVRQSVIESVKVSSEELLEGLVLENAQLRIELQAQKLLNAKLVKIVEDMEDLAEPDSQAEFGK
jgi:hypothetical protein